MLGFGLLVAHSVKTRGISDTLRFLLPVLFFGWLKEAGSAVAASRHEYIFSTALGPRILGVPLIIPVGWAFAFYLGRCVAETAIERIPKFRGNLFALLSLLMITVFCISLCVEVTGAGAGWWVWQKQNIHDERWIINIPKFVLIGWTYFSLFYTLPFFLMNKTYFKRKRIRKLFPLIYLFPLLGKVLIGPAFNVVSILILFAFIFVLPFTSRIRLE